MRPRVGLQAGSAPPTSTAHPARWCSCRRRRHRPAPEAAGGTAPVPPCSLRESTRCHCRQHSSRRPGMEEQVGRSVPGVACHGCRILGWGSRGAFRGLARLPWMRHLWRRARRPCTGAPNTERRTCGVSSGCASASSSSRLLYRLDNPLRGSPGVTAVEAAADVCTRWCSRRPAPAAATSTVAGSARLPSAPPTVLSIPTRQRCGVGSARPEPDEAGRGWGLFSAA